MNRRVMVLLLRLVLLVAIFAGATSQAHADSCSASMSEVSFGDMKPITRAAVQVTGTLTVTCNWLQTTLTPQVLVCLNLTAATPRLLKNGTNSIQYDLYQDAGYTVQWGATSSGTTPISVTLNKPIVSGNATVSTTVPIYGRIVANQPTVPTANNSTTAYTQNFTATDTVLRAGFYLLLPPSCPTLTGTASSFPFQASTNVINDCTIVATNVAFGTAGLLSSALTAVGSLSVQCTNSDAYRIALDGGSAASVSARKMQRSGGGAVSYQLYVDSAHTLPWGDGTGGTSMMTATGTGNAQSIPVYGVVPPQATPAPGNYTDTITATISF
jgi:spore coat protein U-like protein